MKITCYAYGVCVGSSIPMLCNFCSDIINCSVSPVYGVVIVFNIFNRISIDNNIFFCFSGFPSSYKRLVVYWCCCFFFYVFCFFKSSVFSYVSNSFFFFFFFSIVLFFTTCNCVVGYSV